MIAYLVLHKADRLLALNAKRDGTALFARKGLVMAGKDLTPACHA
jgi:hypothetical protein